MYTFLVNKWYFDELIDMVVVRPSQWFGRFAESVLERVVIAGGITGGTVGIVRAGSAAVRRAQTGFLRYYAAAIVVGAVRRGPLFPDREHLDDALDPHLAAAGDLADRLPAPTPTGRAGHGRRQPGHARGGDLVPRPLQADHAGLQFVTDTVWISALGIHYKLGLDGLNVALLLITTVLFSAALIWAAFREWDRPRQFYFQFGLAQSAVLGAFCAQDLALFVVFFDLMLIPFYFLIGMWGTGDRVRATTKLVIYTLIGSFFMLVAAIATGVLASSQHGTSITFAISALQRLPLSHTSQEWIFLCFAAAFLVKMPLVPFHGWLPDGYKAMPIPAVAVFSGVLSKVAAYGFLRIVLPLFPYASVHFQTLMLLIALVSILWATSVAFTTPTPGSSSPTRASRSSASSRWGSSRCARRAPRARCCRWSTTRLVTAPLFFIVAALAARAGGSEKLRDMGGIAFRAPVLATLFLIVALATLAMPGSSNFVGEFLILLGVFKAKLADRADRLHRRGRRRRLRAAGVHPLDAQPRRPGRHLAGDRARRRRGGRPARARDPRARAVSAVRPKAHRADRQGAPSPSGSSTRPAARWRRARRRERRRSAMRRSRSLTSRARTSTGRASRRSSPWPSARCSCCSSGCCPGASCASASCRLLSPARAGARRSGWPSPASTIRVSIISGALRVDDLALILDLIFATSGDRHGDAVVARPAPRTAGHGEYYSLLLFSVLGMAVLVSAQNLVTLFLGIELLSIPLYVLCASENRREGSLESGLKYLIIGSVGSATLVYGLALVYGATGSTDFCGIAAR